MSIINRITLPFRQLAIGWNLATASYPHWEEPDTLTLTIQQVNGQWLEAGTRLREIAEAMCSSGGVQAAVGTWEGEPGTVTAEVTLT